MNSVTYRFDLIRHLAWRDFVLRYKGSVLGILWSLLPTLAQLLVLVFVFSRVVPLNIEAYPAFVFCGLLPWIWFSTCLNSASYLFVNNRDLLRRPNFPASMLVLTNILSNLLHFLLFLPILVVLLVFYNRGLGLVWVFVPILIFIPLLIIIQLILTIGLGLMVATLNVFYHDVQYVVSLAVMLLFYVTPVFYKAQVIPERFQFVYQLNPLAQLIQNYQRVFFYGSMPNWGALLVSGCISMAVLGLGYWVYRRCLDDIYDTL
jgi:homopolymeric O-antigen transport system permease protein